MTSATLFGNVKALVRVRPGWLAHVWMGDRTPAQVAAAPGTSRRLPVFCHGTPGHISLSRAL